jgi:hypothetical protein
MFNPQEVTGAHLSANAREQSTASAETASNNLLGEKLPSLVPARDGQYKAFVSSRLATLFHTVQQCPFVPVFIEGKWQEIIEVSRVREAWGLTDEDASEFAKRVYSAKFNFTSGSPGYVGDLYILQGDALTDAPPRILRRDDSGTLTPAA